MNLNLRVAGAFWIILVLLSGCTSATGEPVSEASAPALITEVRPAEPPAEPPPPPPRKVTEQPYLPFAEVGGITLLHPSSRIEQVGFHEANHDGARQMQPLPTIVSSLVLETRNRGTGSHSAADIVADPQAEIRSPVTGTVIRGGSYVLYCNNPDHFVVISPDARPEWEVKILHMNNLQVASGDRVTAGVTVLSSGPRKFSFKSQVDELRTAEPAWPHVHVEVVDPSIPNRPRPGGGGGC